MSLAILFHFLCTQHVSDINISIIRSLRLFCWIITSVVWFSVRCALAIRCGWVWVVSVLQASIVRSLYSRIFSASFLITFLSPEIATSIDIHVPFSLSRIIISGLLLGIVLSVCTYYYYYYYYRHHHHHHHRRRHHQTYRHSAGYLQLPTLKNMSLGFTALQLFCGYSLCYM